MKKVRFKGQHALCFDVLGELHPGDERLVVDQVAANLLCREDFEVVVPPKKAQPASKLVIDKSAPRGADKS